MICEILIRTLAADHSKLKLALKHSGLYFFGVSDCERHGYPRILFRKPANLFREDILSGNSAAPDTDLALLHTQEVLHFKTCGLLHFEQASRMLIEEFTGFGPRDRASHSV